MKIYQHIFFDLDRTLWDFDRNSALALMEVLQHHNLHEGIPDAEAFIETYHRINVLLWDDYRKGAISKERLRSHRFYLSLKEIGINDRKLADRIGADYLRISPTKTLLIPHTRDILEYLSGRYHLHILTNGFHSTQTTKIGHCGIKGYFDTLITSETVGHHKPSKGIFGYALEMTGATSRESLMVGDDLEVDIIGARDSGIDQVYFNPGSIPHKEKVTYEISSLAELKEIL
jgi:putative hydrolase of the HAD superfamily